MLPISLFICVVVKIFIIYSPIYCLPLAVCCCLVGFGGGCFLWFFGKECRETKRRNINNFLEAKGIFLFWRHLNVDALRICSFLGFFCFCVFLELYLRHMEVPRVGVESKLQLPAYTTATATQDPKPTEQGQGSNPCPHGY